MYSHCLVCRAPFPETGLLEHIPRGDRVAFDLHSGRLWLVCRSCRRWSLVPLEARWEAMEELEVASGEARVLSRTSNIALLRRGSLEIVRVGSADLAEESWWRYGRQLPPRSRWSAWTPPFIRQLRFGSIAWLGHRSCSGCGFVFRRFTYADRGILMVRPEGDSFALSRRCPRCKDPGGGGLRLSGIEAELVLARVMAFQNDMGESRVTVRAAARLLEDPEAPAALVGLLSRHGKPLRDLQPIGLTALEITVGAARERTLMRLEIEALQARWRDEEKLAALVDGELSPVPLLDGLKQRFRGGG